MKDEELNQKHSSEFWHILWMIRSHSIVLDPDGWDRKNWEKSWNEPITLAEFEQRVMRSTICPIDLNHAVKSFRVFLHTVIGENDYLDSEKDDPDEWSRNLLREEQRKRAGL